MENKYDYEKLFKYVIENYLSCEHCSSESCCISKEDVRYKCSLPGFWEEMMGKKIKKSELLGVIK
jgi:hypothetical protein